MFKRKIYDKLLEWKDCAEGSTAILIEGARRIGKSTIAEEFGKNEYASYVLIDFAQATDEFKQTFLDTRNDLDSFFLYLSAWYNVILHPRNTLIIFDEVQLFPKARQAIKHLVADGRYDYLETGSLISINSNVENILIPSEEESLRMFPMDFEEFLWAMGETSLANAIRWSFDNGKALPNDLHRKAMRLWREYMLVGGMPQAVERYSEKRDIMAADRVKKMILDLYRKDIEKYGGNASKRIKAVFDSIPGQLSKHEKRLSYTQVESGTRARDFMTAFAWMKDAATANLCTLSTDPSIGLALTEDETVVKCYLCDTGLLSSMAYSASDEAMPQIYRQVLMGDANVNEGMLAENAIAQQLTANGYPLHFYSKWSDDKDERMEIDFLLVKPYFNAAMKPRISPIEVKSGKVSLVSMDKFKAKFKQRVGTEYVIRTAQFKMDGNRVFLPLYMAFCL